MILTHNMIMQNLSEYANPKMKLQRLVNSGQFFPVTRGVYETNKNRAGYLLAECIYSPSYLSFEFALSFHDLIPETVYAYTSATFNKRKKKFHHSSFGNFYYKDIPASVFYYEVLILNEDGYFFKIASPEKAICDTIYSVSSVRNLKEIETLLLDDLRIDWDDLEKLNLNTIEEIAPLYRSGNVALLAKFLKRKIK